MASPSLREPAKRDAARFEIPDIDGTVEALRGVLTARLGGDGRFEIRDSISGNVNCIYKIKYAGQYLGVRITFNQYRFKYEKDIIKEVFAIYLMCYATPSSNDSVARDIIDRILRSPVGSHIRHSWVRSIVHYDWSRQTLPFPFFIYEWVEGQVLWETGGADQYYLAGQDLARLHRIGFDSYYRDIFQIGRTPLDWPTSFGRAFADELALAGPRLPPDLFAKVKRLDTSGIAPRPPCLVHNDYAGGNIVVAADGARNVIDWDNWVVESPELDVLKMKYWTAIGGDNLLAHDAGLMGAFLEGYGSVEGAVLDEDRLRAYEHLWLLRAFNFESAKREDGDVRPTAASWDVHYPPPAAYEDYLRAL